MDLPVCTTDVCSGELGPFHSACRCEYCKGYRAGYMVCVQKINREFDKMFRGDPNNPEPITVGME